jgi:transcription initiation factor TFIIH subunit 4
VPQWRKFWTEHKDKLDPLEKLRVCITQDTDLRLNPPFRKSLIQGLAGDSTVPSAKRRKTEDAAGLGKFAWMVWENILNCMVRHRPPDASGNKDDLSGIMKLLKNAELIKEGSDNGSSNDCRGHQITQEGFQFLLKDVYSQLWIVIKEFLKYGETQKEAGFDKLKILQFLFHLGYCKVGKAYPTKALDPVVYRLMRAQLRLFGIVYVPPMEPGSQELSKKHYYVTPLGLHLTSKSKARPLFRNPDVQQETSGYIIVETNYRVYAYCDTRNNPLQVALLNLFVDVQYCLPNLAVGLITRESVLNALRVGISSTQLLGYLYQRAHPEMQKNNPVLPETVVDQVRLWEKERNRITAQSGALLKGFQSEPDYRTCKAEAEKMGGLLYHVDTKQVLVVSRECEDKLSRRRARNSRE